MTQAEKDKLIKEISDKMAKLNPNGIESDVPMNSEYWMHKSTLQKVRGTEVEPEEPLFKIEEPVEDLPKSNTRKK